MDIVQLISEHGVQLRKAGRTYKGLCPFHVEKTPSFTVDPDRRTFHCFGCSEQGDAFDYLMKREGIDKAEALRVLAERAGVQLTRGSREEGEHTKRLLAVHETALFYFRQALRGTPGGAAAAAYLAARGISPESIDRFALGYAPGAFNGLLSYLRKRGFSDDEAVVSGLVGRNDNGMYDRFRERLIVPIRDGRGRTIAFGGRATRADQQAKYVNSPQSPLFNKSATLYALDTARAAIRKASEAVIVEGYFDAIAAHQAGFDNVVASMGTALTGEQYAVLQDMKAQRAVVTFDADSAGTSSAEKRGRELVAITRRYRGGKISTDVGTSIYVAQLQEGDPDELARTDPERLRAVIREAKPLLEFVFDRIAARYDLRGPDGRRRFLGEALPLMADEPDALTRELYLGRLTALTGVPQEQLREEAVKPARPPHEQRAPERPSVAPKKEQSAPTERYLMAQLIAFPEVAARIDLAPEDLADDEHRQILELLRQGRRPGEFPAQLAATAAALAAQTAEPATYQDIDRAIEIAALRLREQGLLRRLGDTQAALARASAAEAPDLAELVSRLGDDLASVQLTRERATVLRGALEE